MYLIIWIVLLFFVCLDLNGVVWQSVSLPLGGSRLLLCLGERTSLNPVTITNLHLMHICTVLFTFTSSSAHWNISAMSFIVVHSNHLCAFFLKTGAMFMSSVISAVHTGIRAFDYWRLFSTQYYSLLLFILYRMLIFIWERCYQTWATDQPLVLLKLEWLISSGKCVYL